MELKEAIDILKNVRGIVIEPEECEISAKSLSEAINTVLQALEVNERELESTRKFIDEEEDAITERNNKICELEYKNIELQKENEKLKEIDFTTLYMMGVSDGKTKLENKIKENIEELDKNEMLMKYNYEQVKIAIDILNELLIDKEPKKYSTYEMQRNIMPELLKGE